MPLEVPAQNLRGDRLAPVMTCAHLGTGSDPSGAGRFYPSCSLGGAADRLRWQVATRPHRKQMERRLRQQSSLLVQPYLRWLDAASFAPAADSKTTASGEGLPCSAADFLEGAVGWVVGQVRHSHARELSLEEITSLVQQWMHAWRRRAPPSLPTPPFGTAGGGAVVASRETLSAIYPGLSISWDPGARRLAMEGEIDGANLHGAVAWLCLALRAAGELEIDLTATSFADPAGPAAIARVARTVPSGGHIRIHGMTAAVEEVMRDAGVPHSLPPEGRRGDPR